MTACGQCLTPLTPQGKSLYFCGSSCQSIWMEQHGERITWSMQLPADDNVLSDRIRSRWGLPEPGKEVA